MIPRGIAGPLARLVARTLCVATLLYLLFFLLHVSHSVQPQLTQLLQPRLVSPSSSSTAAASFHCHECSSVSRREPVSGVYTCHDCNLTRADLAPVYRPVSRQTALGLRANLVDDLISETRLLALFHCQWHSSWWCHAPAVWVVDLVLDSPSVSFNPVTLAALLLLAIVAVYWVVFSRGIWRELTREREKRLQAAHDTQCLTVQAQDQLCGGSNTLHTQ